MGLLTADMKRVVEEQRLGFVATVCPDGTPNLSPKGTTAVWDDDHLVFANICSPGTLANLRQNANVEVNVVDPFVRKGYRFKGVASVLESGALYDKAITFYKERGSRVSTIREVVLVRVQSAQPIVSPAYDLGLTEDEVRTRWLQRMSLAPLSPTLTAGVWRQATTVDDSLETLKAELERFGEANDAATNERPRRMLNTTRDTGEFLSVLVRATGARRVLEIGTSNGYSTLWLTDAARAIGGSVTTIEFAEYKVGLASANFTRSGLSPFIRLVHDDAARFLQRSDPSAYDLIFLDAERPEYPGWWPNLRRVLRAYPDNP
jgi:predicted O-methyltransferase YrrM/predicted pyridoxine 5'-phosphate oxidase superfamily flavin-nucleotide-binding protein